MAGAPRVADAPPLSNCEITENGTSCEPAENRLDVPPLDYRPELDFLRAVAVLGVLYAHFWDESSALGQLGVRLFFVLSGFLITDILLGLRHADGAFSTPLSSLTNFFVRRAIRIWPAYYLTLGGAIAFNLLDIRAVAGWHLTFTSNILFALRNDHVPWVTSAWWSLALEEQFYLLWPMVILLPKRSTLPWIVGILIYVGIFYHFTMAALGQRGLVAFYLPPAAFGALGTGAVLALLRAEQGRIPLLIERIGLLSLPLVVTLTLLSWTDWVWAILDVLPMAAAVSWGVRGARGWVVPVVRWRPILWLGRISYGIYLYHLFVMLVLFSVGGKVPALHHRGPALFVVGSMLSVAVATLSWFAVEAPFNRLKRYFPYSERHS